MGHCPPPTDLLFVPSTTDKNWWFFWRYDGKPLQFYCWLWAEFPVWWDENKFQWVKVIEFPISGRDRFLIYRPTPALWGRRFRFYLVARCDSCEVSDIAVLEEVAPRAPRCLPPHSLILAPVWFGLSSVCMWKHDRVEDVAGWDFVWELWSKEKQEFIRIYRAYLFRNTMEEYIEPRDFRGNYQRFGVAARCTTGHTSEWVYYEWYEP